MPCIMVIGRWFVSALSLRTVQKHEFVPNRLSLKLIEAKFEERMGTVRRKQKECGNNFKSKWEHYYL